MPLVCGLRYWPFDMKGERRVGPAPPFYGSVYRCVQNILLACRALGLGATLTTAHREFESRIHTEFGISDEYGVVAMIPIGYPLGKFGLATRKPLEEVVSLECWGNSLPVAQRVGTTQKISGAPGRSHPLAFCRLGS